MAAVSGAAAKRSRLLNAGGGASSIRSLPEAAKVVEATTGKAAAGPSGRREPEVGSLLPSEATASESPLPMPPGASGARQILTLLDAQLPHFYRRNWLDPRPLVSSLFLSGMRSHEAYASPAAARSFVEGVQAVRRVTLVDIAAGFTDRRKKRARCCNPTAGTEKRDRVNNPLVAMQSAPGGGKSSLLDLLSVMSVHGLWDADLCPDKRMRAVLNDSVPIAITFNSGMDPSPDAGMCDEDDKTGLALRVLYSFFVRPRSLSLDMFFFRLLPGGGRLSFEAATRIRACMRTAEQMRGRKGAILLLVDEIVRLARFKPGTTLLPLLGQLQDTFSPSQLNIVVTTLDATAINTEHSRSGRPVKWARLPAIGQAAAEAMMMQALHRGSVEGSGAAVSAAGAAGAASGAAPALLPLAVRIAISDAAGHPRTLQYVLEAALKLSKDRTSLAKLRRAVLEIELAGLTPSYATVELALRGAPMELSADCGKSGLMDEDEERQLHHYIARGFLLNTDAFRSDVPVVPKLSMFRLLLFASCNEQYTDTPAYRVSCCIRQLARLEEVAVSASEAADDKARSKGDGATMALGGALLENLLAQWLHLMTIVRAKDKLSALDLFHADGLREHEPARALTKTFSLAGVTWKGPRGKSCDALAAGDLQLRNDGSTTARGLITTLCASNPAFGVLMTVPHIALAVEARGGCALVSESRASSAEAQEATGSAAEAGKTDFERKWRLFSGSKADVADCTDLGTAADALVAEEQEEEPDSDSESSRDVLKRLAPPPIANRVVYVYAAARHVAGAARLQRTMCNNGVILLSNDPSAQAHVQQRRDLAQRRR